MFRFFQSIGQYTLLMQKVFSRPEKGAIYRRRIMHEMEALGLNSIGLTAIISVFIGCAVTLQMAITLESPFIPQFMIGYFGVLLNRCGTYSGRQGGLKHSLRDRYDAYHRAD